MTKKPTSGLDPLVPEIAFTHGFAIRFDEADEDLAARPPALFRYLQEAAIHHSRAVGRSPSVLRERGLAWFLTRFRLRLTRRPHWEESVRVHTWPSSLKGLYAVREFTVRDGEGRPCAVATSRWVLIDLNRRRPVRLPDWIAGAYAQSPMRPIDEPFDTLAPPADPAHRLDLVVRRRDLDPNGHASSASYLEWLLEAAYTHAPSGGDPVEIDIAYLKEANGGESVRVETEFRGPELSPPREAFQAIRRVEGGDLLAAARLTWSSGAV